MILNKCKSHNSEVMEVHTQTCQHLSYFTAFNLCIYHTDGLVDSDVDAFFGTLDCQILLDNISAGASKASLREQAHFNQNKIVQPMLILTKPLSSRYTSAN